MRSEDFRHTINALLCIFAFTVAGCIGLAGCDALELQRMDEIMADVNAVGQTIGQIPDSPAGALIPVEVRTIMEVLGLGAAAAYGFWMKLRRDGVLADNQKLRLTGKAIVAGIERLDGGAQAAAKEAVGAEMAARHIRDTGRAMVEELKTG